MPMPGDMIHELKNHLGIILGFAELMIADMPEDDRRRDDLQEIRKAALRALELLTRAATPPSTKS